MEQQAEAMSAGGAGVGHYTPVTNCKILMRNFTDVGADIASKGLRRRHRDGRIGMSHVDSRRVSEDDGGRRRTEARGGVGCMKRVYGLGKGKTFFFFFFWAQRRANGG